MKKIFLTSLAALVFFSACNQKNKRDSKKQVGNPVDKVELKSETMTPEALWSFGRVSGVKLSPDNSKMLFSVAFYNVEENSGNREIFVMPVDGGEATNITNTENSEFNARWRPDGEKIGFLTSKNGSTQLW
jgi:Tol biopolymer transport system component